MSISNLYIIYILNYGDFFLFSFNSVITTRMNHFLEVE